MKTTYFILAICIIICTHVSAQNFKKRTLEEKATYYTNELVETVKLDSVQIPLVFDINLRVSRQFDSLYASNPDPLSKRNGSIAIYKQRDSELRKVLSKQQFLMFDDFQREKREKKKKAYEEKQNLEKAKLAEMDSTKSESTK
jgi:hypothetical protein